MGSDRAPPASAPPLIEIAALLIAGFAWIYYPEWSDASAWVFYSAPLLALPVSIATGSLLWWVRLRDLEDAETLAYMHAVTESATLLGAGAAFGMLLAVRIATPPPDGIDLRALEEVLASSALAVLGSLLGVTVFMFGGGARGR